MVSAGDEYEYMHLNISFLYIVILITLVLMREGKSSGEEKRCVDTSKKRKEIHLKKATVRQRSCTMTKHETVTPLQL